MKKRILSLLLAVVLVCSLVPTAFAAESLNNFQRNRTYTAGMFTDVAETAWYAKDVKNAYELNLVNGSGSAYNPNGNVTLAESITIAARIYAIYTGDNPVFVQGQPWYQAYVDYAVEKGIIGANAYPDYNKPATRAQFASIFSKALPVSALSAINDIKSGAIPDVPTSADYAQPVYLLYNAGILAGSDTSGTFNPDSNIQRSECAAIVTRMANPSQRKTFKLLSIAEKMEGVWHFESSIGIKRGISFKDGQYLELVFFGGYVQATSGTYVVNGTQFIPQGKAVQYLRYADGRMTVYEYDSYSIPYNFTVNGNDVKMKYGVNDEYTSGPLTMTESEAALREALYEVLDYKPTDFYCDQYGGRPLRTVTSVTGAACSKSYADKAGNIDIKPVAQGYQAGCNRYYYKFETVSGVLYNGYKNHFLPYIEYLKSLPFGTLYEPTGDVDGFVNMGAAKRTYRFEYGTGYNKKTVDIIWDPWDPYLYESASICVRFY